MSLPTMMRGPFRVLLFATLTAICSVVMVIIDVPSVRNTGMTTTYI